MALWKVNRDSAGMVLTYKNLQNDTDWNCGQIGEPSKKEIINWVMDEGGAMAGDVIIFETKEYVQILPKNEIPV